jgi:hypothetical protein
MLHDNTGPPVLSLPVPQARRRVEKVLTVVKEGLEKVLEKKGLVGGGARPVVSIQTWDLLFSLFSDVVLSATFSLISSVVLLIFVF